MEILTKIFRALWKIILALSLLIGIIYLPLDISGLQDPEITVFWRKALTMLDQNTALWVFSVLLLCWLAWVDVRPWYKIWRGSTKPLRLRDHIYCESQQVVDTRGNIRSDIYRLVFYLIVTNNTKKQQTLRNVGVSLRFLSAPLPLKSRRPGESERVHVRHGEEAYFELGSMFFGEPVGAFCTDNYKETDVDYAAIKNLKNGHYSIFMGVLGGENLSIRFSAHHEVVAADFLITVSADDTPSSKAELDIDLRGLPDLNEAFKIKTLPD